MKSSSDILVTPEKMNSTPLWLTGNTDSIYAWMTLDLKADGPTVMEILPNVMGPLDDAYFRFVVDFGATGPDKGKGGKYLILPPGYEGEVPEGYFASRDPGARLYPDTKLSWETPFIGGNHEFLAYGVRLIDRRVGFHFYATGILPKMVNPAVLAARRNRTSRLGELPTNGTVPP